MRKNVGSAFNALEELFGTFKSLSKIRDCGGFSSTVRWVDYKFIDPSINIVGAKIEITYYYEDDKAFVKVIGFTQREQRAIYDVWNYLPEDFKHEISFHLDLLDCF